MIPLTLFSKNARVAANMKILLSEWPTMFLISAKSRWRHQIFSFKETYHHAIHKTKSPCLIG